MDYVVVICTSVVIPLLLLYVVQKLLSFSSNKLSKDSSDSSETHPEVEKPQSIKKKNTANQQDLITEKAHKLFAGVYKGHSSPITDINLSSNGKYLASSSSDRAVILWSIKEIEAKEKHNARINIDLDYASCVYFSPDTKAILTLLQRDKTVRIFRLSKKDDASPFISHALDFEQNLHSEEIVSFGVASNGKYIMTADCQTTLKFWSIKGDPLASIDTKLGNNARAVISPCAKFVAVCGFTPDVKVWAVCFDKADAFKEVKRAFELKGHSCSVHDVAFNLTDSKRMATVSRDGQWRVWDVDIEWVLGQDAKLVATGSVQTESEAPLRIALSPDGLTIAITTGHYLHIIPVDKPDDDVTAIDQRPGNAKASYDETQPSCVAFDNAGKFVIASFGRFICCYHNAPGFAASARDFDYRIQQLGKSASQALRDRLHEQKQRALEMAARFDD